MDPAPPGLGPDMGAPPGISRGPEGQPPGLFQASGAGAGRHGAPPGNELQKEISSTIEAQVAKLIEEASQSTAQKVKIELKQIMEAMKGMDARLDQLLVQIDGVEPSTSNEPPMDVEAVGVLLSKIEQQWGQEIRMLKQELHQTILAHNHNADLIKHHKDTIDALRERCTKLQSNKGRNSEIVQQMQRLDARLKQQQKSRKLEPLFERLERLEQRVAVAAARAYGGYGMPHMVPPGVPGVPPNVPLGMMPPHPSFLGKGAGAKGAGMGLPGPGAAAKIRNDKAAYRHPTDEEVQARLGKLSQAGAADSSEAAGQDGGEL